MKGMGSNYAGFRFRIFYNKHAWGYRSQHKKHGNGGEKPKIKIPSNSVKKVKEGRWTPPAEPPFSKGENLKLERAVSLEESINSAICESVSRNHRKKFLKTSFKSNKNLCSGKENITDKFIDSVKLNEDDITSERRFNALGIQMLSRSLYQQLFGKDEPKPTENQVLHAQENLSTHGLLGKSTTVLPDVSTLCLPALRGGSIESHFQDIGEEQAGPYRTKLLSLVNVEPPKPPSVWSRYSGWTRYGPNGEMMRVDFPDEDAIVFDVEVCRSVGEVPTMATALSPTHWYSWVCSWLAEDGGNGDPGTLRQGKVIHLEDLIPLESKATDSFQKHINRVRIVVAHHASYDRARVKEQYWPDGTGLRFFDTLSTHVCIGGVTSYQRAVLSADERRRRSTRDDRLTDGESTVSDAELDDQAWREVASLNSLAEAHRLHCGGPGLDKTARSAFDPDSPPSDILLRFQELMKYCSKDTKATHELFCVLFPQFLERFPHPVTLAGMLELGTARLPVSHSCWNQYLLDASETHDELESELKVQIMRKADEACRLAESDGKAYSKDLWMWDQDWTTQDLVPKKSKITKRALKNDSAVSSDKAFREFLGVENDEEMSAEEERLSIKFMYLIETRKNLPSRRPHMSGYPKWYRQLCPKPLIYDPDEEDEWVPTPSLLTTNARIAPKLLRLCWEKYPLHYVQGHGWGILVPGRPFDNDNKNEEEPKPPLEQLLEFCPVPYEVKTSLKNIKSSIKSLSEVRDMVEEFMSIEEWIRKKSSDRKKSKEIPKWYEGSGLISPDVDMPGVWFCRLPHRDGPGKRVGNPLSKDFLDAASDATLSADSVTDGDLTARSALTIGKMVSYWRNNRDRVNSQLVVRLPQKKKANSDSERSDNGFILPQLIVCGTLTRRAVEPTWMTASNAESDRVGSELRAMVRPPKQTHCLVGADVDSQELWIAALLGDASDANGGFLGVSSNASGLHGGTPLGWRTLQGKKSEGTDMHSATAAAVGCSRDQAKVLNYARIYGAGHRFASRLLQKFSPILSAAEASKKADVMMVLTKGKRVTKKVEADDLNNKQGEASYYWEGGSESAMFNALEKVARMDYPETPFLRARLSKALEPERVGSRFLPTRINWVVQSGAVDFLHLLLVAMRSLSPGSHITSSISPSVKKRYDVRFALSFHDEVRYIVPISHRYEAALRLHVAHLLVRAFCSSRVGLNDLPMSVAFFNHVSVDSAMRKEPNDECITPSNPHGLFRGHGVPAGESLDIYTTLEKVQGRYTLALIQKVGQNNAKITKEH